MNVEPIWPTLFSRALEGKDIGALVSNVGAGVAAAPSAGAAATGGGETAAKEEAKEEEKKKEESEEESDDDMGFGELSEQSWSYSGTLLSIHIFLSLLIIRA